MLDESSGQMDKTDSKQQRFAQAISLLGPLIGLLAVILARSADLGAIASILLVVVAACSLYVVLGRPCVLAARRAVKTIREHSLVPQYLAKLDGFVKRLQRLCDRNYCDNVPYVLRDFPQLWGGAFADSPALDHLARFVDALGPMLSGSRRSKKNMVFSLRLFELILQMYNRQCVCEPVRQIINRVEQGLDEDKKLQYERLKREYQKVKLGYVVFLEQYGEFTRDLNSAFGENIACDYFDRPPEL